MNRETEKQREISSTVITPHRRGVAFWSDLWRYRELLFFLGWRDVAVRYKQTVLGFAWSAIRPFTTMVVFSVIFGKLAQLPTEGSAPYPVLVFAGLLPWQFFAAAAVTIGNSISVSSYLITKVYFPRLMIPIAALGANLVDLAVSLLILAGLMAWYGFLPPAQVLLLPIPLLMTVLFTLGFGIFTSALSVKYRDARIILPFLIQIGFFISPVGFSAAIIPEKYKLLYSLNPMVPIIESCRWCLIPGAPAPALTSILIGVGIIAALLIGSVAYFRATERTFADMI